MRLHTPLRSLSTTFLLSLIGSSLGSLYPTSNLRLDRTKTQYWPGKTIPELNARHDAGLVEANLWMQCMILAAFWANEPNHPNDKDHALHNRYKKMVHTVLGDDADLPGLKEVIYDLADFDAKLEFDYIDMPDDPNHNSNFGAWDSQDQSMYIYKQYHEPSHHGIPITAVTTARTLVHEYSHGGKRHPTFDYFAPQMGPDGQEHVVGIAPARVKKHNAAVKAKGGLDGHNPITAAQKADIINELACGYWHSGYPLVRKYASQVMHLNADSIAALGFYCHYGKLPIQQSITELEMPVVPAPPPRSIVWTAPQAGDPEPPSDSVIQGLLTKLGWV